MSDVQITKQEFEEIKQEAKDILIEFRNEIENARSLLDND